MSKKKMSFSTLLVGGLLLALALYFIFFGLKILNLKSQEAEVREVNAKLTKEKENLETELNNISSKDYMERLARKDLKLVKANELIFILPEFRKFTNEEDVKEGQ